jgi:hypothetical protein
MPLLIQKIETPTCQPEVDTKTAVIRDIAAIQEEVEAMIDELRRVSHRLIIVRAAVEKIGVGI